MDETDIKILDCLTARNGMTTSELAREVLKPKFGLLGPQFKSKAKEVGNALETASPKDIHGDHIIVVVDGSRIKVDRKYFDVVKMREKVAGERVVPHVIEPSHGLDRIMYTCLEHAYTEKQDKEGTYVVMRLSPISAPVKVGVFPLMGKEELLTWNPQSDVAKPYPAAPSGRQA